ncbi:MAG: Mov34/MPN/PAD-1 family protein [Actinomycetota bacterium]
MQRFGIPSLMAQEIIDHAQAEYPKECCGLLAGTPGEPRALYKLTNIDPDPVMRYNADPHELKRINDEIYEKDWDIVCIYHSHTHSPAFPSPTDVARAFHPDAVYELVSLADRGKPDLRAFRILDGNIEEIPVVQES